MAAPHFGWLLLSDNHYLLYRLVQFAVDYGSLVVNNVNLIANIGIARRCADVEIFRHIAEAGVSVICQVKFVELTFDIQRGHNDIVVFTFGS